MYFKYGGYQHPDNEVHMVNFEVIPQYSERGEQWGITYRIHLSGEIIATGQSDINDAINTLVDAYDDNDKDAGLYHDDGSMTRHVLLQGDANNLTGNKIEYRSWPSKGPCEYATFRSFKIIIRATFRNVDSEILTYRESVRFIGTGGPMWRWIILPTGQPFQQQTADVTTQKIIQAGNVLALSGWPLAYVQPPLLPLFEHEERRLIHYHEPKWAGQTYIHYGISWVYYMEAPPGQSATPNLPIF
jgi:hypothetical protein